MKHKSRFLLPILTFLTFGMVTGSIVAADYVKEEAQVADADTGKTTASCTYIILGDEDGSAPSGQRFSYKDDVSKYPWVHLENIVWTDGSGYTSVNDVTDTTGSSGIIGNYTMVEGNSLNCKMVYLADYDNYKYHYYLELPWYISSCKIYFYTERWDHHYYLTYQSGDAYAFDVTIGGQYELYFNTAGSWGSCWDSKTVSGTTYYFYRAGWRYESKNASAGKTYEETTYSLQLVAGSNGAVSPTGKNFYKKFQIVTITANPNTGYQFSSWTDGGTQTHTVKISSTSPSTITASFAIKKYTMIFKSGDGSGSDVNVSNISHFSSYTLKTFATCSFTAPAYKRFTGWKDQHGTTYIDGQTIASVSEALTFTAQYAYYETEIKVGSDDWQTMSINGNVGVANCYTTSEIDQSQGVTVQFHYRTSPSASWTAITPSTYVGSYHNNGDNFGLNDSPTTFKYDNVSGIIDLQVFGSEGSYEFKSWAHGTDSYAGEDCHFDIIVTKAATSRNTYLHTNINSASWRWDIASYRVNENDIIRFYNSRTDYWYTPSISDGVESGCFEKLAGENQGIKCKKTGDYYLDIRSSNENNKGDTFNFDRLTWTVDFNLNGKGSPKPEDQIVTKNGKATAPTNPTSSDAIFSGWYTDPACGDEDVWTFSTDTVTSDTTLYAKWDNITASATVVMDNRFGIQFTIAEKYAGFYDAIVVNCPDPQKSIITPITIDSYEKAVSGDTIVTVPVNNCHMGQNVTISLKNGETLIYSLTKSIKGMFHDDVSTGDFDTDSVAVKKRKIVLTYGTYAQLYFGVDTANLANSDIQVSDRSKILTAINGKTFLPENPDISKDTTVAPCFGISGIGFGSNDGLTIKYVLNLRGAPNADHLKAEVFGERADGVIHKDDEGNTILYDELHNYYYVEVIGIDPTHYLSKHQLKVSNKTDGSGWRQVQYDIYAYLYTVHNTPEYKDDTALYNYCKAVNYFCWYFSNNNS